MDLTLGSSWYWLALIGIAGGTLSGALGVGGGVLIVPALALALGYQQKVAQGTCLAVMAPMALMAWYRYHVNPDIKLDMRAIFVLIPFVLIGANFGSSIAAALPGAVLRKAFGAFVILAGIKMLLPTK